MGRLFFVACAVATIATPAIGQMNPVTVGQGLVMPSAINAQASEERRHRHASGRGGRSTAQRCASVPEYRRTLGADNPTVIQLAEACRRAGYGG